MSLFLAYLIKIKKVFTHICASYFVITSNSWSSSNTVYIIRSRRRFSSDQQISSFFSKIFGNKICQTLLKQLESEGFWALYMGFPFFIRNHFHASLAYMVAFFRCVFFHFKLHATRVAKCIMFLIRPSITTPCHLTNCRTGKSLFYFFYLRNKDFEKWTFLSLIAKLGFISN